MLTCPSGRDFGGNSAHSKSLLTLHLSDMEDGLACSGAAVSSVRATKWSWGRDTYALSRSSGRVGFVSLGKRWLWGDLRAACLYLQGG